MSNTARFGALLTPELKERMRHKAAELGCKSNDVLIAALEAYLGEREDESDTLSASLNKVDREVLEIAAQALRSGDATLRRSLGDQARMWKRHLTLMEEIERAEAHTAAENHRATGT